jgi:hypothetical protein
VNTPDLSCYRYISWLDKATESRKWSRHLAYMDGNKYSIQKPNRKVALWTFMACILLCICLYNIYLSKVSLHNKFFYNDKINTTVSTFVLYVRVMYRYMFRPFYLVIFRSVQIQASVTELLWIILHTLSNFEFKI